MHTATCSDLTTRLTKSRYREDSGHSLGHHGSKPGSKSKERIANFGKRPGNAIWKCLVPRLDEIQEENRLIIVGKGGDWRPMSHYVLGKMLKRIGERAGVSGQSPQAGPPPVGSVFNIVAKKSEGIEVYHSVIGAQDTSPAGRPFAPPRSTYLQPYGWRCLLYDQ